MFALNTFKTALRVADKTRFSHLRFFSATKNGTVKWFDSKKGFGFIVPDDGSPDVFVHQTCIHAEGFRSLADGEPVEFTTIVDERGRTKADRVTGPMGAFVQGAPRRSFQQYGDSGGFGGGGFGGGFGGGGFGGGGGGFGGGGYGDSSPAFGSDDKTPDFGDESPGFGDSPTFGDDKDDFIASDPNEELGPEIDEVELEPEKDEENKEGEEKTDDIKY